MQQVDGAARKVLLEESNGIHDGEKLRLSFSKYVKCVCDAMSESQWKLVDEFASEKISVGEFCSSFAKLVSSHSPSRALAMALGNLN